VIDFLYIVSLKESDVDALERFRCSVQSVLKNDCLQVRICVADISEKPLLPSLLPFLPEGYGYAHKAGKLPYNRGYNANFGFKNLVTSTKFFLSDTDIVYGKGHIKQCLDLHYKYPVFAYRGYRMAKKFYSANYELCRKQEGTLIRFGGGFLCDSKLFERLNGFDEEYVGYGAEDSDFFNRASRLVKILRPSDVVSVHLWHPPFDPERDEHWERNKERYLRRKKEIMQDRMDPTNINKHGWGE
tara:strand:+ start:2773 stop:3501 length:729 start_codon:yes stop_codon:yes gene_type:complete